MQPFINVFGQEITVFTVGREGVTVKPDHPKYDEIKEALKSYFDVDNGFDAEERDNPTFDWDEFFALCSVKVAVEKYVASSNGVASVIDGQVCYNGKPLHNVLTNKILQFMEMDLPVEPMLKFLERVMLIESYNSREQLYDFLVHRHMPIQPDGMFIGWKRVKVYHGQPYVDINGKPVKAGDFISMHTAPDGNGIRNNVGDIVDMDRSQVDDNSGNHCSTGLHVGAIEYVIDYGGRNRDENPIIRVAVDPVDCVSVPTDCSFQKLRTCRYLVIEHYTGTIDHEAWNDNVLETDDNEVDEDDFDYIDDEDEDIDDFIEDEDDETDERGHNGFWGWLN
jgi:hypothetical protein